MNASHTIIIGDDELSSGSYTVRDLNSGDQSEMTADGILNFVKDYDNKPRVN